MSKLSEKAMLSRHMISVWTGRKFDSHATSELLHNKNAASDAGRFNKSLVCQSALRNIQHIARAARNAHIEQTLPWYDAGDRSGMRILPSANFFEYQKQQAAFKEQFAVEVEKFLGNYYEYIKEAIVRLGDLFNEADYPSPEELETKFSFDINIAPMHDERDFRIDLGSDVLEELEQDVRRRMCKALKDAQADIYDRLRTTLEAVHEPLKDSDKRIYKVVFDNLQALVELMPRLNIAEDPQIDRLKADIDLMLSTVDVKSLRDDDDLRDAKRREVESILSKMGVTS